MTFVSEAQPAKLAEVAPAQLPVVFPNCHSPSGFSTRMKFVIEWLIALFAVILFLPMLLLIAVLVRLESKGPALFVQPRYGRGGKPFPAFKFRSMRIETCDPAGGVQTRRHDSRVTQIGRVLRQTSLDELPQLFNVLRGEMALVGPRAHPVGMRIDGRLCEQVDPRYHDRHVVRPGITGWAQVSGSRGPVDTVEQLKVRLDLDAEYLARWSIGRDLLILARTVAVCLSGDKAY
ncbi:MAG: exopolysaccharide biosynthesis protein [Rhodobacteraceae bacterium]|nr:MAG: exopolysaccharide biosynthesis protein [Paracoccaceae bacterium]